LTKAIASFEEIIYKYKLTISVGVGASDNVSLVGDRMRDEQFDIVFTGSQFFGRPGNGTHNLLYLNMKCGQDKTDRYIWCVFAKRNWMEQVLILRPH